MSDKALAKRREVLQITHLVICKTNVVNPVYARFHGRITALRVDFTRKRAKSRFYILPSAFAKAAADKSAFHNHKEMA